MLATTDPIKLLKDDHNEVKKLFKEFEGADGRSRKRIANEAIMMLEAHAQIEEEIFYPAFLKASKEKLIAAEAEEEHHVAEQLMTELKEMLNNGQTDVHFEAKFTVLAENVKHHIEEEEKEMLPKAQKEMEKDLLKKLGEQMAQRKEELISQYQKAGATSR